MPQMSPTWWTSLFIMFVTAFMLLMMNMYFSFSMKMKSNNIKMNKTNHSYWKW